MGNSAVDTYNTNAANILAANDLVYRVWGLDGNAASMVDTIQSKLIPWIRQNHAVYLTQAESLASLIGERNAQCAEISTLKDDRRLLKETHMGETSLTHHAILLIKARLRDEDHEDLDNAINSVLTGT